jgi:hypothetical protein
MFFSFTGRNCKNRIQRDHFLRINSFHALNWEKNIQINNKLANTIIPNRAIILSERH